MPSEHHTTQEPLAEAAELFRENEALFGDVKQDKEKANLYRGLAALAEGLAELQGRSAREER
jgi:hypothetical protein